MANQCGASKSNHNEPTSNKPWLPWAADGVVGLQAREIREDGADARASIETAEVPRRRTMWPTRIEVERIEVEAIHVHYIVAYESIHGGRHEEAAQSSGLSETPELLCRTLHAPHDRHRSSPAPY